MRTGKSNGRGQTRGERKLLHRLRRWLYTVETHRLTLALFTAAVITAISVLHLVPDKVSLQIGEVSPQEIRATRAARYIDTAATDRLRSQLLSTVTPEYEIDPYAVPSAEAAITQVFARLESAQEQMVGLAVTERARRLGDQIRSDLGLTLPQSSLEAALKSNRQVLESLGTTTRHIVLDIMRWPDGIREGTEDIQKANGVIATRTASLPMPAPQVALVRAVAQFAVRPTRSFSSEKTEQARKRVEALVKPVLAEILPGEPIIHKGETVTQAHLDKFTALGLRRPRMDWLSGFYVSLFILGMVAIIASYIYCYHRTIYNNWHWLWLLALILIGSMAAFKLGGSALGIKLDTTQYGYFGMFCVSTAAMLIAVLLSPSLAVVIASLLSLHVGIMTNYDLRFTGVALVSSLIGIHSFSHIRDRGDLVRSLLVLCSAGTLAIWVLGSLSGDSTPDLFIGVAWGIGSSMLACLITWLAVALLERPFGITTHFGLLELSDMNQPALRRLLQEAPGTYIHSLNVGQLAEAAAEVCGADPLLARVGAYYHDIGKVMRPYCFVENQTVENIHNRLNPTLSTLVVTSHIKDGIELAREYRLPSVISGVIRSHHGTGLVKYFYHQAMRASDGECPPEHQFRYEGPKPRTKEQGIIMLADSVESAVRAALADRPDPSRIQAIVARIIKDKSADGQLDECDLTFRDLTKLTAAFTRILQGIFHARIKYPEPLTEEGQALNGIGSSTAAEHPESPSDSEGDGDNRHELTAS